MGILRNKPKQLRPEISELRNVFASTFTDPRAADLVPDLEKVLELKEVARLSKAVEAIKLSQKPESHKVGRYIPPLRSLLGKTTNTPEEILVNIVGALVILRNSGRRPDPLQLIEDVDRSISPGARVDFHKALKSYGESCKR